MDDPRQIYKTEKVLTLDELAKRRDEFEVPKGAIEAFKSGAMPVVVFLRSTGEEYMLADPHVQTPLKEDSIPHHAGS